jgi:hypothetical protein
LKSATETAIIFAKPVDDAGMRIADLKSDAE